MFRSPTIRYSRLKLACAARCIFCALALLTFGLAGCHRQPSAVVSAPVPHPTVTSKPALLPIKQGPLPLDLDRSQLAALIEDRFRRRFLAHRTEVRDLERITQTIRPIIEAAARQPEAQSGLEQMAEDQGITVEEARAQWIDLQEADLLLEAGGDPDAVSRSKAVGAAQWMAGPGNANGLTVDLKESERLSAKIYALRRQIAWRDYLLRPANISRPQPA